MTAVRAAPIASESTGLQQSYNQDPSLPSNIQWPSFVPAAPRQIDSVLYTLSLAPTAMRHDTFDAELSEYIVLQQQARAIERMLLEEHQLMVSPPSRATQLDGSDYQWKRPHNMKHILMLRDARIRRLEYAYLDLRLRRARLEVALLDMEQIASKQRLTESLSRIKSPLHSTLAPSISGTSSSHVQANLSSPFTVGYQPLSSGPDPNDPGTSRTTF